MQIPIFWLVVLLYGFCTGIVLDLTAMATNKVQTQEALDASTLAGATKQQQVTLQNDSSGAATRWKYEIRPDDATVAAEETWDKNIEQLQSTFGAEFGQPTFSFPDTNTIEAHVSVNMTPSFTNELSGGTSNAATLSSNENVVNEIDAWNKDASENQVDSFVNEMAVMSVYSVQIPIASQAKVPDDIFGR